LKINLIPKKNIKNQILKMSNSTSNITYFPLSVWLYRFGSAPYQEKINLSFLPVGIIGTFLNILSLKILQSKEFDNAFYIYMRAYIANSICLCAFQATRFLNITRSIFSFSNSYAANWYIAKISIPFVTMYFHYSSFLNIVMSFERIVLLSNKLSWFKRINPIFLLVSLAIVSIIIDAVYFCLQVTERIIFLNETEIFKTYLTTLPVSVKLLANTLSYIFDIVPLVIEISLSVIGIIMMKSFVKKKTKILASGKAINPVNGISNTAQKGTVLTENLTAISSNNDAVERAKKMEIKLTLMTIVLTYFSIL
jgi:hypothetical protein